ncbi:MAG: SLC13 family permease [Parasphingopyxis sp.]|uniref:SLC13 family permease n=1 Tax=Parasphingopyxis sp. TaxID=1920299 RepID=UPI0032EB4552
MIEQSIDVARAFIGEHQAVIGLVILGIMFVAFIFERFPAAVIALFGACTFLFLGILDSDGLLSVFSNPAPITIGAMFVLSGALLRTGTIDAIASTIVARATRRPKLAIVELMLGAFIASAFMNNTPVVLVMIPIIARLAEATNMSVKRLLIPLSYVCIMGGMMTLIGTSTNLIVDAVARDSGMEPFDIFEITPYAIMAALAGAGALAILGPLLLPEGKLPSLYRSNEGTDFLTELIVLEDSDAIGRPYGELAALRPSRLKVQSIKRDGSFIKTNLREEVAMAGDHVVISANMTELLSLRRTRQFEMGIAGRNGPSANAEALVEATIAPTHPSLGRRLADIPFLSRLRVRIIGITRHRQLPGPDLPNARMRAADRVLVTGSQDAIRRMYENPNLLGVGQTRTREFRRDRAPIAILALAAVVTLAALNIVSIAVAAILAMGIILATRCIDAEEAWGSIDGNVLILIFAMLAVGVGLERAGSVDLVVAQMVPFLENAPPWALIFVVYLLSVLMTEIITNNAVAVIVTPIVIGLAAQLGTDPRPLVIAVMFAASASFATPIGYQTNTLVYAAGNYRFTDFIKIGLPLTLIVGFTTCCTIAFLFAE